MQKKVYLIGGTPRETHERFSERIIALSEEVPETEGAEQLKICLTHKHPPRISIIPFQRKKIASISVLREKGNPFIFFGPPWRVPIHMYQVPMDTRSFIDMSRIETYVASEIHLKS